jgi:fructose-specific phosphotransferase system component IIB
MIDCGVKKIPEAHIMKRWTREARDYQYPDDVCTSPGEQLGQSLLFANALDVVRSTDKNPKAGEILTRYLNMARKEIEGLEMVNVNEISPSDGNNTSGYMSASGTEAQNDEPEYDSDGLQVLTNTYGASGSSAYMSDADINSIKAPLVSKDTGHRREKRFKPLFERRRKGRKRYTATTMLSESIQEEGNQITMRIENEMTKANKGPTKKKRNIQANERHYVCFLLTQNMNYG